MTKKIIHAEYSRMGDNNKRTYVKLEFQRETRRKREDKFEIIMAWNLSKSSDQHEKKKKKKEDKTLHIGILYSNYRKQKKKRNWRNPKGINILFIVEQGCELYQTSCHKACN